MNNNIKEIILLKNGELVLKGLNRRFFENLLLSQLRDRLSPLGKVSIKMAQSTVTVEPLEDSFDLFEAERRVSKVFGIAAYSRAGVYEKDLDKIMAGAAEYLKNDLNSAKTFKVEARRSDKTFPFTSPEIASETGGYLLKEFPHLSVDLHNPDMKVVIEVRDAATFVRPAQKRGAGGMPVGSGGKAALLLSGGIDSPVAGYMMAKRGLELTAIHFVSPPYTSERALLKVEKLAEILVDYAGKINLLVVPFTEIQMEIKKHCPENLFTIVMRRFMIRISNILAKNEGCEALVTGECVGQVASQTLTALAVTQAVSNMPVLAPLIGMDKNDIIKIARKLDTYETSILPYEDCCTVFTPRHPRTHPDMRYVLEAEQNLDINTLVNEAVEKTYSKMI